MGEIFPVNLTRLRMKGVIGPGTAVLRPSVERQEGIDLLKLLVLGSPRAKGGPNGDHEMCIVLMYILHHLLRRFQAGFALGLHILHVIGQILAPGRIAHLIYIIRVLEFHCVPVGVASPVLPVLHDGICRNLQLTILVEHASQLVTGLVSFATLPEAHRPSGKHGRLSCQLSDACDDTILRAVFVHEIIVGTHTHLTGEGSGVFVIIEVTLSGIVPIDTITLLARKIRNGNIRIVVPQLNMAVTLAHMGIAKLSQTIHRLIVCQSEALPDAVLAFVGRIKTSIEGCLRVTQKRLAFLGKESNFSCTLIECHSDECRLHTDGITTVPSAHTFYLLRLQNDRIAFLLFGGIRSNRLDDTNNRGGIKFNVNRLVSHLTGDGRCGCLGRGIYNLCSFGTRFNRNACRSDAQKGHHQQIL